MMRTFIAAVFIAGLATGELWNGHGALTLGAYALLVGIIATTFGLVCAAMGTIQADEWEEESRP